MPIVKQMNKHTSFTIISNEILQRNDMSFEAKGVLCELLSRPNDWYVRKAQFIRIGSGRDKVNKIFKELKDLGYFQIENVRENNKIVDRIWNVYAEPQLLESLTTENLNLRETATTKERYIQSKDNNKINISESENLSEPIGKISNPVPEISGDNNKPNPTGKSIIAKGDKIPQEFIDFWKSYKGWKLGMKSAWELFKTHSDYRDCLGLLCSAVKSKIKSDLYLSSINQFTPQWKHLKNWITDRCWEEVPPLPPKGDTGYEPEFEAIQDLFGDYDQEG